VPECSPSRTGVAAVGIASPSRTWSSSTSGFATLILEFGTAEDAGRIAREAGGPSMNAHIRPLLAADTERSVREVIAFAEP
jgi:hypothetical protein